MQSDNLSMIRALISQASINDLLEVKLIVDDEIQWSQDNMTKQKEADQYETTKGNAGIAGLAGQATPMQDQNMYVSASGATSSHVPLRYDLIPRSLIEIAARRYTLGAKKHGERGYQKGMEDWDFILNRINHITEHWNKLFHPSKRDDLDDSSALDHLGAILWGIGFLCELVENHKSCDILYKIISLGKVQEI